MDFWGLILWLFAIDNTCVWCMLYAVAHSNINSENCISNKMHMAIVIAVRPKPNPIFLIRSYAQVLGIFNHPRTFNLWLTHVDK